MRRLYPSALFQTLLFLPVAGQAPVYERASCVLAPFQETVNFTYDNGQVFQQKFTQIPLSSTCRVFDRAACRKVTSSGVSYIPVNERTSPTQAYRVSMDAAGYIRSTFDESFIYNGDSPFPTVGNKSVVSAVNLSDGSFIYTSNGRSDVVNSFNFRDHYRFVGFGFGPPTPVTWTVSSESACLDCTLSSAELTPKLFPFPRGSTGPSAKYRISIPFKGGANGGQNTSALYLRATVTEPTDATITNVKLELVHVGQTSVLVDWPRDGSDVRINGNEVTVRATMGPNGSPVVDPGPGGSSSLTYRLNVTTRDGQCIAIKEYSNSNLRPLWDARRLVGANVFGTSEPDGDKWADPQMLPWLTSYQSRLDNINDISGEHGNNNGHTVGHLQGLHIDAYLYGYGGRGRTLGPTEASSKFQATIERLATRAAVSGTAVDIAALAGWVGAMRNGLTTLLSTPNVSKVLGPLGTKIPLGNLLRLPDAGSGWYLPLGWADKLIRTGVLSLERPCRVYCESTLPIVGIGVVPWQSTDDARYRGNPKHNDHLHVELRF